MNKSKLHLILETLSTKEKAYLIQFVSNDLYCKDTRIRKAISYLTKIDLTKSSIDKEKLFKNSYPGVAFDATKQRLLQSQVFKLIEKFIKVHYALVDTELNQYTEVFLLKYYRQHKLEKLYNSQAIKLKNLYDNSDQPIWDAQMLRTKLDTEVEVYQHESSQKRRQALNLQDILDTIDLMYYTNKLKFACMAYAHQTVFNQNYQLDNLKWILEDIQSKQLSALPLIGAYYHAYHMIREPNNDIIFEYFNTFLIENESKLATEDLQTLYLFALNQCIRQLNSGKKTYGLKGLALYERALKNGVLLMDGYLSRFTYRNIAMMAIRSYDLDWAAAFTHKYVGLLQKNEKQSAFNHNLALIYYYRGQFDEALTYIQEADFKDHLIHLAAKTLQAKIYYELDADQALYSLLDSVEIYLIRNKIIGYHRHNYRNIIKYFKKLSRTNMYDRSKKEKLIDSINNEETLTEKKWLLEKLGA